MKQKKAGVRWDLVPGRGHCALDFLGPGSLRHGRKELVNIVVSLNVLSTCIFLFSLEPSLHCPKAAEDPL